MILKASKRGGARDLARHLLKPENEHVEVHELRGFMSDTLGGALSEAQAVSLGTRCRKYLFSLSLSPPELEKVPVADFEAAIERIEGQLGLSAQPRAIVFHEKEGRRHAHCVWSRIKLETMTAIDLPYFKLKLLDISRDLYLEHDWRMPAGMIDHAMRSPLSFDMGEWFKAKRTGQHPRDIKLAFKQCWNSSDSSKALKASLEQFGFFLAKGDRRSAVVIDMQGEVYNFARWLGVRSKEVALRLDPEQLPTLESAKAHASELIAKKIKSLLADVAGDFRRASAVTEGKRLAMVERHREVRRELESEQAKRVVFEAKMRAERYRKGILGLWDRVTGAHRKISRDNDTDLRAAEQRDREQKDELIDRQLKERQKLQIEIQHARRLQVYRIKQLLRDQEQNTRPKNVASEPSRRRIMRSPEL